MHSGHEITWLMVERKLHHQPYKEGLLNMKAIAKRNNSIRSRSFYLMLLPGVIMLLIFSYLPLGGLVIAFQNFIPAKGLFGHQKWVGLETFQYLFLLPDFGAALKNTLIMSFGKIILGLFSSILFAILLNEMRVLRLKKVIQTFVYLPHFISWVILASVFVDILSPSSGLVGALMNAVGLKPIFFLGDNKWFQFTMIFTDNWKEFGFGTIVFLAAITSISPNLYEAAVVDGANKFKQILHITLPGMIPIITLISLLNVGNVLNANFDQIFNLYSPQVYRSGDILDTLVYRIGIVEYNYSLSTAVGAFKSIVSLILISTSYYLAYRIADYRVF